MKKEKKIGDLLCRFVIDGSGKVIGESVSFMGDILIIKMGKDFIGVPIKHIEDLGNYLRVRGLLSIDKARELGKLWEEKYEKRS